MKNFTDHLANEIEELKQTGRYKRLRTITSPVSDTAVVENYGESIILCSNNYLGLNHHPDLMEAAHEALNRYGTGPASVRFICGTYDIHRTLEEKTASFLSMDAALTYSSCWSANTAAIPALLTDNDTVISDELNHASIIDACRLCGKKVNKKVYRHSDMQDLEQKLKESVDSPTVLVVTDGVFSMEGDLAKLPQIITLCKSHNALLMVDESHATGVIGNTGRGTAEFYNLKTGVDIYSGTYGKALGGAGGGFIASSKEICDMLIQRSRPHLFSNSLPPVLCAIAYEALRYVENNPQAVQSLNEKQLFARRLIAEKQLESMDGNSPIIPIILGDTAKAIQASDMLMEEQIYTIGFGFPVVPEGKARIRLQISNALHQDQIEHAIVRLHEVLKKIK